MKKLLGVTGCPTGIAHTYMAEEALKEAAKKLGAEMKVETNGAVGVENALTAEDIAECDGIIVACDKNVDMKRFKRGNSRSRKYFCSTSDLQTSDEWCITYASIRSSRWCINSNLILMGNLFI